MFKKIPNIISSLGNKGCSFFKTYFKSPLRILFLCLITLIILIYVIGAITINDWALTTFFSKNNWVIDALNTGNKIYNHPLKVIEVLISAMAFGGLALSVLYQRAELISTKKQFLTQSNHIEKSIQETNRNSARNTLSEFNKQLISEINNSNFKEIQGFLKKIRYIEKSPLLFSKIIDLHLDSKSMALPTSLINNMRGIYQTLEVAHQKIESHYRNSKTNEGYSSGFDPTILEEEIIELLQDISTTRALMAFQQKIDRNDENILQIIHNMISATEYFNSTSISNSSDQTTSHITPRDPVHLVMKSILQNSCFIYESNFDTNNFRISSRALQNFFNQLELIEPDLTNGEFRGFKESDEFNNLLVLMKEYGIIRDTSHFGYYVLYGEPFIDECSTKE